MSGLALRPLPAWLRRIGAGGGKQDPPPAAPLVERDMVRDFARSVLAEPLVDLETMRPLWAEGADR